MNAYVSTAAELAEVIFEMNAFQRSRLTDDGARFIDADADRAWRNAAAREGDLYAEALYGGGQIRRLAFRHQYGIHGAGYSHRDANERANGCPVRWDSAGYGHPLIGSHRD